MQGIEKLVLGLIKNKAGREKFIVHYLDQKWADLCGVSVAKHSKPVRLENGILYLHTDSPSWSHNLLMMKNQLLGKIANKLKARNNETGISVKDIYFLQGKVMRTAPEEEKEILLPEVELTKEEKQEIKAKVQLLQTEKIKKSFVRLLTADKKRKTAILALENKRCKMCGVPILGDKENCLVCEKTLKNAVKDEIADILRSMPWLTYKNCINLIKCDRITFNEVKGNMINLVCEDIYREDCPEHKKTFAVMLVENLSPDKLSEEIIAKSIEKMRRKKAYVSSYRIPLHSKKQ